MSTATLEKPEAEAAEAPHWQERPLDQLPDAVIPPATMESLKRQGIDTIGKLADALNDGRDIGLGDKAEQYRAAVEDLIKAEVYDVDADEDNEEEEDDEADASAGTDADDAPEANGPTDSDPVCGPGQVQGKAPAESSEAEETLGEIYEQLERVTRKRLTMERTKAAAKTAKDEYDEAVLELQGVIRDSRRPNLFTRPKEKAAAANNGAANNGKPAAAAASPAPAADQPAQGQPIAAQGECAAAPASKVEECWKQFPLERWKEYGLTDSIISKLTEHSPPILTVGDLQDFLAPKGNGYTQRLVDIAGVGKGTAGKIEEAGIEFWKQWAAGLREKFAKEKGLIDEKPADAQAAASDWAQPGVNGRPEK